MTQVFNDYRDLTEGRVSRVFATDRESPADRFAISMVTVDGHRLEVGDVGNTFPLYSISKPFVFGLALDDHGAEAVGRKIGVEPTGTAFDGLLRQEEISRRRYNPMVNLGAIATTGLIRGPNLGHRQDRLLGTLGKHLGREVRIDEQALDKRRRNDGRNRAMAYFMQSEGLLSAPVEETLDLYHAQCSAEVCCTDAAVMAATLANRGVNPVTGERALAAEHVKRVLTVMFSSGLYDYSGQWAYEVGIPAKCSVTGTIIAVVPGRMGIAVHSPRLDANQKSVRAVRVLADLSRRLDAHLYSRRQKNGPRKPRQPTNRKRSPSIASLMGEMHERFAPLKAGRPYEVSPAINPVDPDRFGICAVSVDGRVQGVGDWQHPFLLQSISKVFVYGMALEDRGRDYVRRRVDVEPTGDPYDAIIKLEQKSKRPFNPMVNTGGIATANLIRGRSKAVRLQRILQMYSRYVGQEVRLDVPTRLAEQAEGDRNRAITYLLRHFGMMNGTVEDALDLYLQQCSVIVTARDLAVMAATLAGGGVNPLTGERAIAGEYVTDLLSVMHTCGMYDFAGRWAYRVGLPAKSGVGGGIMAVVPGRMGVAVFSPPLDERGNSVRGIRTFEELSCRLGMHVFEPGNY